MTSEIKNKYDPHFLDDDPCSEDAFCTDDGLGPHRRIADMILNLIKSDEKSKSIALIGPWGSGKSSIIRMIKAIIDSKDNDNIKVIEYNAWANEKDPIRRSLMLRMIDKIVITTTLILFLSLQFDAEANVSLKIIAHYDKSYSRFTNWASCPVNNNMLMAYRTDSKTSNMLIIDIVNNNTKTVPISNRFIQAGWFGQDIIVQEELNKWKIIKNPYDLQKQIPIELDDIVIINNDFYHKYALYYIADIEESIIIPNDHIKVDDKLLKFKYQESTTNKAAIYDFGTDDKIIEFPSTHKPIINVSPDEQKLLIYYSNIIIYNRFTKTARAIDKSYTYYWLSDSIHLLAEIREIDDLTEKSIRDELYIYNYVTNEYNKVNMPFENDKLFIEIYCISEEGFVTARLYRNEPKYEELGVYTFKIIF